MIGRVKLKSKRAAFSISSARDGGAKAREEAARRERDLRVEGTRDKSWGLQILRRGVLGSEICSTGTLGGGEMEETGIRGFEEAMIMLAMAADECVLQLRIRIRISISSVSASAYQHYRIDRLRYTGEKRARG